MATSWLELARADIANNEWTGHRNAQIWYWIGVMAGNDEYKESFELKALLGEDGVDNE